MKYAFDGCTGMTVMPDIPGTVTTLDHAFHDCTSLTYAKPLPYGVQDAQYCFQGCTGITSSGGLGGSITKLTGTFAGCTSLKTAPALPASATTFRSLFNGCTSLEAMAVNWSSQATDLDYMYCDCYSLASTATSGTNISFGVKTMNYTFRRCYKLKGAITIRNWLSSYTECFLNSCNASGGVLKINYYKANKNQIDAIIATKGAASSKIQKGTYHNE